MAHGHAARRHRPQSIVHSRIVGSRHPRPPSNPSSARRAARLAPHDTQLHDSRESRYHSTLLTPCHAQITPYTMQGHGYAPVHPRTTLACVL
eukprot:scaffold19178_cov129-Isochrysis_galbana.AAC.1